MGRTASTESVRETQARVAIWYATPVRRVAGELEAENWRQCESMRGVAGEWKDENWRVGSTTGGRGASGELDDALATWQYNGTARKLEAENW